MKRIVMKVMLGSLHVGTILKSENGKAFYYSNDYIESGSRPLEAFPDFFEIYPNDAVKKFLNEKTDDDDIRIEVEA